MNVLFVEDEAKIANFVRAGLKEQGFVVDYCDNGDEGYLRALENEYDVLVLDIMVPGKDGLSILKLLRRQGRNTPIILLTARNELDDRLEGLNLGADDYIAKPFFVEELAARIHAVVRRSGSDVYDGLRLRQNLLCVGPLKLDRITREVTCNHQAIELTSREFNLLEYLMRSPGRVFTRTQILEHVWGYDFNPNTNVVDVCIQRIRKKLTPLMKRSGLKVFEALDIGFANQNLVHETHFLSPPNCPVIYGSSWNHINRVWCSLLVSNLQCQD